MRTYFVVVLLAFAALSGKLSQTAAEDADENSEARIEELRKKLENLHKVLAELSQNIDDFDEQLGEQQEEQHEETKKNVLPEPPAADDQDPLLQEFEAQLSPDDQELLHKMHSKVKFLQAALHEPDDGPNPGEEKQEEEGDGEEEETAEEPAKRQQAAGIDDLLSQLSPEEQALIQKHPSMAEHLQKAFEEQKEGDHNGEAESDGSAKRQQGTEMDELLGQLSPEQQALIQKHPSMAEHLLKALEEQKEGDHNGEAESEGPAKRQQDAEVDEFLGQLSPEQQALVQRHPSMLAYLKQALQEQNEGDHNGAEESEAPEAAPARKKKTQTVDDMLSNLSPADQELVEKNPSMLDYLQQALQEQQEGDHNGPAEEEVQPQEKRVNGELSGFIRELSPEDQKLVESHPSVWEKLQAALEEGSKTEDEPNADEEAAAEEERKRGEEAENELNEFVSNLTPEDKELLKDMKEQLEKVKDAIEEYHQNKRGDQDDEHNENDEYKKPEDDEGEPSEDDGDDKRHNVDPRCKDGERCADALSDVEGRFVADVAYAKRKGVDMKELLRVLSARRVRGITEEERELEMLRQH